MGVYGTSGTLDAADIDYDDEEEAVLIECTNCGEEYYEEQLTTMNEDNIYQENVCERCIERYIQYRDDIVSETINDYVRDHWHEGQIQP